MVFHTYILNNSFAHTGYLNLDEWLVYNDEHTRKLREQLVFILNTSQVTVGQLRCFEMTPLGMLTAFDAPDLGTLRLVTAGNHFPPKHSNLKPFHPGASNTFVEKFLRRRRQQDSYLKEIL